jgi:phosphatidylglycerol:prolipoprotein diacylglycerol transferase
VDSVPFTAEVVRGQILPTAAHSLMLHPTQLYSSMNALVLAILTWNYFPYRRRHGEVLLLAWLAYPVTRFCLEILRDEPGQFGTPVTISQWVSLLLFGTGLVFWYILSKRPLRERERPQAAAAPVAAEPQPTRPVPA